MVDGGIPVRDRPVQVLKVDIGKGSQIQVPLVRVIGLKIEMRVLVLVGLLHDGVFEVVALAQRTVTVIIVVHPLINRRRLLTDGSERRMRMEQGERSRQPVVGNAVHSDLATVVRHVVQQPFDGVVSVGRFVGGFGIVQINPGRKIEDTFGLKAAAQILNDEDIAILGKLFHRGGHLGGRLVGNTVRSAAKQDGQRTLLADGRQDRGLKTNSIAHRNHDLLQDEGGRLWRGAGRSGLLSSCMTSEQNEQNKTQGRWTHELASGVFWRLNRGRSISICRRPGEAAVAGRKRDASRSRPGTTLGAHRGGALEQASYGEVHATLAGRAEAAGNRNGTDDGIGDDAEVERPAHHHRTRIARGCAKRGASLVPPAPVDFFPNQLREAIEFSPKAEGGVSVVVAQECIPQIGSEAERPSQFENLKRASIAAERAASGNIGEKRGGAAQGNEVGGLQVELIDGVGATRTLQNARETGDDAGSRAGDGRAILSVPHEACADFAGAATSDGETCGSNEGSQLSVEQSVADAKFTATAGIVANVETTSRAFISEDGNAREAA